MCDKIRRMLNHTEIEGPFDPLERLWNSLLSRQPELVRAAFLPLQAEEKQAVLIHLRKMVSEPGWHPEQQLSAGAALKALEDVD